MHSSRMHTARSKRRPGGLGGLQQAPPVKKNTPRRKHPLGRKHTPQTKHPPGGSTPWRKHPPVTRMTNRCKNITLPQTSIAGGKNPNFVQHINGCFSHRCDIISAARSLAYFFLLRIIFGHVGDQMFRYFHHLGKKQALVFGLNDSHCNSFNLSDTLQHALFPAVGCAGTRSKTRTMKPSRDAGKIDTQCKSVGLE